MSTREHNDLWFTAYYDSESDTVVDYTLPKKHRHGMRRSRARSFKNNEDKNNYYRMYNENYTILMRRKIDNAKKLLRSEGYIVMEKE